MERMESLNRIELRGTVGSSLTSDINGSRMCRFSVATNYAHRGRDNEPIIETTWHRVIAWEKDGRLVEPQKGDSVEVTGRLRANRYTGADGFEYTSYEVIASEVKVLEGVNVW